MNKKLLAVAISSALAVPMAAQAVNFKISGHVNRAIQFVDDGVASDVANVDNGTSQSRLIVKGWEDLGIGGMKVGLHMEVGITSNNNFNATMKGVNGNGGANDSLVAMRHSNVWFSGKWGKLTLGQQSGAYDTITEADLGGSVALAGIGNGVETTFGGDTAWRTAGGGNLGINIDQSFSSFDGNRHDSVRYDTPKFGPLTAAVSVADNQRWNFGAKLAGAFSGAKYQLRGGYEELTNNSSFDQWGISGSVLFSQGTSLTAAYSEREVQNALTGAELRTADTFYIKLGHQWGNNAVAIDYGQTDDLAAANDEHSTWGIGIAHSIPGPNVQVYAGYRNHDLDRPGQNVEDVDTFNVGARVRF